MAYFVADEKLQGYYVSGGVIINIVKYHFECDDAASLPAQTAFISSKKVKISMASTAHTIDTDALYKMDSSGAWVQQSQPWQPLADYSVLSNKPQINGHTLTGNQSGADLGLENTLTFDSTPTQDSANPVTSGGIWAEQQRQETEIGVVANAGAKNLITYTKIGTSVSSGTSYTHQGVTFALLSDGAVSATRNSAGTDISFCNLRLDTTAFYIDDYCDGNHVLSGCPSDGDINGYDIRATNNTYNGVDTGHGVVLSDRGSQSSIWIQIRISKNYSPDNLIFKPMIRPAAITDPTFQPFARTNRELTVLTDEDRAALVELVDGGDKNKLPVDELGLSTDHGTIYTNEGVQFSLASDGTITATRTAEGSAAALCNLRFSGSSFYANSLCDGDHVLSGCPSNGGADTYRLEAHGVTSGSYDVQDTGQSVILSQYTGSVNVVVRIRIARNFSPNNLVFKPMICTKAAWKISQSFQPYRPSWQEMYDMILALQ